MKSSINWQIGKTTTVVKFRVFENQNVAKNVHTFVLYLDVVQVIIWIYHFN